MIEHNDIYIKFMIEYDKAGAATSYPSLTEYEVATFLDKAYNALIAQKVTGNNYRRAGFETDFKSIADLQPLLTRSTATITSRESGVTFPYAENVKECSLPNSMLYFIQANAKATSGTYPYDNIAVRTVPIKLVTHEMAQKFFATPYNMPWVKLPVGFIEDEKLYIVDDSKSPSIASTDNSVQITFIKKPNEFAKDLPDDEIVASATYFTYTFTKAEDQMTTEEVREANRIKQMYTFECNSTVAEELVSLAVSFALENVESQRLNSKLNMRGLEA